MEILHELAYVKLIYLVSERASSHLTDNFDKPKPVLALFQWGSNYPNASP